LKKPSLCDWKGLEVVEVVGLCDWKGLEVVEVVGLCDWKGLEVVEVVGLQRGGRCDERRSVQKCDNSAARGV
jgi:hypothetical protein